VSGDSVSDDSGFDDGDDASFKPRGVYRLLPGSCWVGFLPGLGGYVSTLIWAAGLVLGAFRCAYDALYMRDPAWLARQGLNVTGWAMCIIAGKLLCCIPQIFALAKLSRSDVFDEALRAELSLPSGDKLRRFMKCFSLGFALAQSAVMGMQTVLIPGFGVDYTLVLCVKNVCFYVSSVMFALLWKLSMLKINRLRDCISLHSSSMTGRWARATREYQALVRMVDGMWRVSGLSVSYSLIFASNGVLVVMALAMATVDESRRQMTFEIYFVAKHIIVTCVFLYYWALIFTQCNSSSHATESVLYLGRQHLGRVHPEDSLDHWGFLECVAGLKCGVEIPNMGVVSNRFVQPLIRFACVGVPVMVGLAVKLAARRA